MTPPARGLSAGPHGVRAQSRTRDQHGQVTTTLVIVMVIGLVAVALYGVFWLARGTDERSKAQSAADAAALAGAGALEEAVPGFVTSLLASDGRSFAHYLAGCAFGRDRAEEYAAANDATVTDYCFDPFVDEVRVEVRMNDDVRADLGAAEAGAVAETGLDLDDCGPLSLPSWEPPPTPTPTPTPSPSEDDEEDEEEPSPTPTPTPTPTPPPGPVNLDCGPLSATFALDPLNGVWGLGQWKFQGFEPRLVD